MASAEVTSPKASSGVPRAFQSPAGNAQYRMGDAGILERVSTVSVGSVPAAAKSIMAVSPAGTPVNPTPSGTPSIVQAPEAPGTGLPSRLEACIACHGSGTLPSRSHRRLFRLLTSRPTGSIVSAAPSGPSAPGVGGQNSVSHVFIERGIGLFVELACSHSSVFCHKGVIHWSA